LSGVVVGGGCDVPSYASYDGVFSHCSAFVACLAQGSAAIQNHCPLICLFVAEHGRDKVIQWRSEAVRLSGVAILAHPTHPSDNGKESVKESEMAMPIPSSAAPAGANASQPLKPRPIIRYFAERATILFALRMALLIGTILGIINHGASIVTGHFTPGELWPLCLTYCVPFSVAMYSQAQGKRQRDLAANRTVSAAS
jgi:hypothetical protein